DPVLPMDAIAARLRESGVRHDVPRQAAARSSRRAVPAGGRQGRERGRDRGGAARGPEGIRGRRRTRGRQRQRGGHLRHVPESRVADARATRGTTSVIYDVDINGRTRRVEIQRQGSNFIVSLDGRKQAADVSYTNGVYSLILSDVEGRDAAR